MNIKIGDLVKFVDYRYGDEVYIVFCVLGADKSWDTTPRVFVEVDPFGLWQWWREDRFEKVS